MTSGPTAPSPGRLRADACPGALETHAAADGALARIRIPGGDLTDVQLRVLASAARSLGDGALELTSRGNLQLRGLPPGAEPELGRLLAAAGLLPSTTHERVRNVLASTLSGRVGGQVDVRPWVTALDAGLCSDPALAQLPGRFLVTLDDGRGDVASLGGDVGLLAVGPSSVALLHRRYGHRAAHDAGGRGQPRPRRGARLSRRECSSTGGRMTCRGGVESPPAGSGQRVREPRSSLYRLLGGRPGLMGGCFAPVAQFIRGPSKRPEHSRRLPERRACGW